MPRLVVAGAILVLALDGFFGGAPWLQGSVSAHPSTPDFSTLARTYGPAVVNIGVAREGPYTAAQRGGPLLGVD